MADYDPNPSVRTTNPIACVATWVGGLFRGPTPSYGPAPIPEPVPPTIVRVRAIDAQRAAGIASDGSLCDGDGPIALLTLVVDDAATAATVLEALHTGAHLRVAVADACG